MITASTLKRTSAQLLDDAVHRNSALSPEGLRERLFTFAFRGLVYPQIWEDPVVDMDALSLSPGDRIVTIASGGCNVLSYLAANPASIDAVDLNAAHIALNRLKLCALEQIGDHDTFYRFFGAADARENIDVYGQVLRPHLDRATRAYWDGRDATGRRRITRFARGFYRYGLLGRFIGASHLAARMLGVRLNDLLIADGIDAQRAAFDRTVSPVFERRIVRWVLSRPASLYGLGIPPAQYRALAGNHPGGMAAVVKDRLEKLACGVPMKDNYFAWQAFARNYPPAGEGEVPPYLAAENFDDIRARAGKVTMHLTSFTKLLESRESRSLDCYVLLDAQDWMTGETLNALWREITRTARPGARVIFRTAARETLLPGLLNPEILKCWQYEEERSEAFTQRDRSAIYGGFHLYRLAG